VAGFRDELEENFVNLKGKYGELGVGHRHGLGRQVSFILTKESRGRSDGVVTDPVSFGTMTEFPPPNLSGDQNLVFLDFQSCGGKNTAIVGAAGPGTVFID